MAKQLSKAQVNVLRQLCNDGEELERYSLSQRIQIRLAMSREVVREDTWFKLWKGGYIAEVPGQDPWAYSTFYRITELGRSTATQPPRDTAAGG